MTKLDKIYQEVSELLKNEQDTEPHPDEFIVTDGINHFAMSKAKQSTLKDVLTIIKRYMKG